MARAELSVAVLWHMHQPDYVDSITQRATMPWVRLHALAAYYDMVRAVRDVPGARAVFNVVPVLLRQLEQLRHRDVEDTFLELARPAPGDPTGSDRQLLLQNFFAFNHGRRFKELPRLAELWQKRHDLGTGQSAKAETAFSDEELRDLQVGFHLAWSGRTLREHDLVRRLFAKGSRFSEQEKAELLQLQSEFLGEVLPLYREAAQEGSIEISCTPYCHPILPLLCDSESAREAVPGLTLPAVRVQQPGDAWYHVVAALAETERLLGVRPAGMWPAEGSLSEAAIRIFATEKVSWLGCDQDVLAMSRRGEASLPGHHFQPFRWGGDWAPALFFRDKGLSDRIGFVYGSWQPERAAADMVDHLRRIAQDLPTGSFLVPIILDGENPWEGYPDQGMSFLHHLYRGVHEADGLRWTTFGEFLRQEGAAAVPLARLQAGSWIRNDFTTWIGQQEKNAGWERLHSVRQWLEERLVAAGAL